MCGRFVGSFNTDDLLGEMDAALHDAGLRVSPDSESFESVSLPNFNLAPTQAAPVMLVREGDLVISDMNWGLVPSWAKDASRASSLINARSETVTEKPSFRNLVKGQRCVVPMNGFYEWDRTDPRHKVPHFVTRADRRLLLVAGLWSRTTHVPTGATFCILTRQSGPDLEAIHDRCPVHLDAAEAVEWMSSPEAPLELASVEGHPALHVRRVSARVNSVRNNDPSLIDQLTDDADDWPSGASGDDVAPTLF